MFKVLLYGGFLSVVTCRFLNNDKYLSLDKYKDNDTIYFDPVKVHVIYGNPSELGVEGNDSSMNKTVDKIITSKEDQDEEEGREDNFDFLRFTPIMCEVNGDVGVCTSIYYCRFANGIVISENGNNGGCGIRSCCQFKSSCDGLTNKQISYFVNPVGTIPSTCDHFVNIMNENVCQIRLDFISFLIANPRQTKNDPNSPFDCMDDSFQVITPSNKRIPKICGYNTDQHMYIHINVEEGEKSIRLLFRLTQRPSIIPGIILSNPQWKIQITQLECQQSKKPFFGRNLLGYRDFMYLAPSDCLQYHTARLGIIKNFGYNTNNVLSANNYIANMDYSICFKKLSSCSAIIFSPRSFLMSGDAGVCNGGDFLSIPGAVINKDDGSTNLAPYGRLCGKMQSVKNIKCNGQYPFYLNFVTDSKTEVNTENGWSFDYVIINC